MSAVRPQKINKIDKPLARLPKKKERRHPLLISEMKEEASWQSMEH